MLTELSREFPDIDEISRSHIEGGQKEIYFGIIDGNQVVLKIIKCADNDRPRLDREVAAVNKIQSEYTPKIFKHGTCTIFNKERYYIIEEYIVGRTYHEILGNDADIKPQLVVSTIEQLLSACVDFELNLLVHRDIKPSNIILDNNGKVWLLDFGIARHLDLISLTPTGTYGGVGTPGYGAPEQFLNDKFEINSRADLFAIGIIAYESFARNHPFSRYQDNPFQLVMRMEKEDIPRLSISCDPEGYLADLISALTQRHPSARPQTAIEAKSWFDEIRHTLSI